MWQIAHAEEILYITFPYSDYNQFLEDLEEDPQLRQNVNIYKDERKLGAMPVDADDMLDPTVPRITLEEMLDDLVLYDDNMGEDDGAVEED